MGVQPPVTWLVHESQVSFKTYLKACQKFLQKEPWWNVPRDMFFAVQIDEAPQFYLCLMGNGGTGEIGYLIVDDWAQAQAMLELDHESARGRRRRKATASKGIESVSPQPLQMLSPEDAHHWRQHTHDTQELLLPVRYEGQSVAKPKRSLSQHALLLTALANVPKLQGPGKAHVDVNGSRVDLKWPAEMHLQKPSESA